MKKIWMVFLIITSLSASDHKSSDVPKIFVQEENGSTNRIATGKVDCATDENFEILLRNGQYDLCRDYLGNKTQEEIEFLKKKYGSRKIDNVMGALYAVPEQTMESDKDKQFVKKGGYKSFPLHARAFFGDKESVEWFLKHYPGYDVSTTTAEGYTASDIAQKEGYTEVVQMLAPVKRSPGGLSFAQSKLFWFVLFLINFHLLASSQ